MDYRFGEMESAFAINTLATNLLNEGDTNSIKALAKENGIDEDMTEFFISGEIDFLCDEMTAAIGKLDIEAKELGAKELMCDWIDYIKGLASEDPDMAAVIKRKDKKLSECIGELLKYSFSNQIEVSKEILQAANIKANRVTFGVPSMRAAKEIIKNYYLGRR
jgi:hypothetical protein